MKSRTPDWLDDEGRKAWKRWLPRIRDDADPDAVALMCDLWSKWRATDPNVDSKQAIKYISLTKQLHSMWKQHGLFPDNKKPRKTKDNPDERHDEFADL
jgi:phage terminase small subunit